MSDALDRLVHAKVEFKRLRIPLPHVTAAQAKLDTLRKVGILSKGQPQRVMSIIGPSHCGKSTIVEDWRDRLLAATPPEPGTHPALLVTLTSKATVKSMAADIVNELGADALPPEIVEDTLRRQHGVRRARMADRSVGETAQVMWLALRALQNARTEVLIIDEVHHLVQSDDALRTKWSVTEAIKWLSIKGACPIVCVGIRRVARIVSALNNPQIANRNEMPVIVDPCDIADPKGAEAFGGFVAALDLLLVKHGIMRAKSHLVDPHVLPLLYDASIGIVGRVSRLVEAAVEIAILAGRDTITDRDLSDAVDRWAIPLGITDRNPWRDGPRDLRVIRALAAQEA